MPPQYYLIHALAEILSGDRNTEDQRARVRQLAEGAFGAMVILPRQSKLGDGRLLLAYEGDELVDGPAGARHRAIMKLGPGVVGSSSGVARMGLTSADARTGSNGGRVTEKPRCIHGRGFDTRRQVIMRSNDIIYPPSPGRTDVCVNLGSLATSLLWSIEVHPV